MEAKTLTPEIMYNSSFRKDAAFEGLFIMAVKTTGIFCRPTCTARKPKFENVEFFPNATTAMLSGYMACKVCKPLEHDGESPEYIKGLIAELHTSPAIKLSDYELKLRGIEPAKLRRWFI
jgi:AraC family transcriptional regulator, regulatory protein of adaptative response / methylated-DNA-[protein]-cysteine methyltransferase